MEIYERIKSQQQQAEKRGRKTGQHLVKEGKGVAYWLSKSLNALELI